MCAWKQTSSLVTTLTKAKYMLATTSAKEVRLHMEAVVASIPAPLGVDDNAAPYPCDVFTQDELDSCSLLQLYRRSCVKVGARPNQFVESQLPDTVEYKPYMKIIVLDFSGTYLGPKGVAAVVPVVNACRRLTHLFLPRAGINTAVGLSLLAVVSVHPCLREMDLSLNDLGTTWGKKFLSVLSGVNRRIYGANLHQTLIIPAIKKKIDSQLDQNRHMKDFFNPDPLLTDQFTDEEEQAIQRRRTEEEESRRQRAEAVRKEMSDRIPVWCPVALAEVSELLNKYHGSLQDILSLFSGRKSADSTQSLRFRALEAQKAGGRSQTQDAIASELRETAGIKTAVCDEVPLRDFHHFMKVLGISSLGESTDRCVLFADLFDAAFVKVPREVPLPDGTLSQITVCELVGIPSTACTTTNGIPSLDPRYTHTRNMSVFTEERKDQILIDFSRIVRQLRIHAHCALLKQEVVPDPSVESLASKSESAALYQCCSDKLFDSRKEVIECCELLDVDQTRTISFGELLTGVTAVLQFTLVGQHGSALRRHFSTETQDSLIDLRNLAKNLCNEYLEGTVLAFWDDFGLNSASVSWFDSIKYDALFAKAIFIGAPTLEIHLVSRCSPDAWAHETRSSIQSLLRQ